MTDFERGVFWALELLKQQLNDRNDKLRSVINDDGSGANEVLNGLQCTVQSIGNKFEMAIIKQLMGADQKYKQ